jgi:alpha-tubulin suppressor-like RCC1 family protein
MVCNDRIIDAACGDLHTLVKFDNNQLKTCGGNKNGALGHNNYDVSDKKKRCKKLELV